MSEPSKQPTRGIYIHYKEKKYRVHRVVRHSESLEWLVLYEALYDNPDGQWWVRPLEMFMENVDIDGETKPRFRFVGTE